MDSLLQSSEVDFQVSEFRRELIAVLSWQVRPCGAPSDKPLHGTTLEGEESTLTSDWVLVEGTQPTQASVAMSSVKRAKALQRKKKPPRPKTGLAKLSAMTLGDVGEFVAGAAGAVRRLMNVETHRFDDSSGPAAIVAAGTVRPVTLIAEGDDYNNRSGRSIRTVAVESRFRAYLDPTVALKDSVRVILFVDLENAGATPAVTDVLSAAQPNSPFQVDNLERFVVLKDEYFTVETYTKQAHPIVVKMPLDIHIKFRGATGVAASMAEGAIFWLVISTSAVANTSFWEQYTRVSYVDN